jgi:hypothetical protein
VTDWGRWALKRSWVLAVAAVVVTALALPVAINVATDAIPESWQPYRWVAWPVAVGLLAFLVITQLRGKTPAPTSAEAELELAAKALANGVRQRWHAEREIQELYLPEPLRLRWSNTPERGQLARIADEFLNLPTRQLVVLGAPGAGKTVLAMTLTLGLLDKRTAEDLVPVLVPLSSWDPAEHLHSWLARRMAKDHEGIDVELALRLVSSGRVLPVLDGLDELPAEARATALAGIDRAVSGGRPVVVTSRREEYQDTVNALGPALSSATTIEIEKVGVADAIDFLTREAPDDARWQPVARQLRADRNGPLAQVLSSPLMVWLARAAYQRPHTNPAELLDMSDPAEIERHLLDTFIRTRYHTEYAPPPTPDLPERKHADYSPDQVQQWLVTLSAQLTLRDTADLAWWRLADTVPRHVHALAIVIVAAVTGGFGYVAIGGPWFGGFATGGMVLVGLFLSWAAGHEEGPPSGHARRAPGSLLESIRVFLRELVRGLGMGVIFGLLSGVVWSFGSGWQGFWGGLLLGLVAGLGFGVLFATTQVFTVRLAVPIDIARAVDPGSVLRHDRRSALLHGLAYGVVGGFLLAVLSGSVLSALYFWLSGERAGYDFTEDFADAASHGCWLLLALTTTTITASAWFRFVVARIWFAVRGALPCRLMRFLDDAHRRGVLRQVGAVYQFRHARLAELLRPA